MPAPLRLPELRELHRRHFGLTPAVAIAYAEAAGVCLSRHHIPPTEVTVDLPGTVETRVLSWREPSQRERNAWANSIDATEAGAYSLALAAIEACLGLIAISRAETRTGADYYVGRPDDDLENAYRLEVSGVDRGDLVVLRHRVSKKQRQVRQGRPVVALDHQWSGGIPAIACVVGFEAATIIITDVEPES